MRTALVLAGLLTLLLSLFGCASVQRKLLYFPSHEPIANSLADWKLNSIVIGYAREVPAPATIWLMLHGNGGQAAHRAYALPCFSTNDSVYILEYPGYGLRSGTPSKDSLNRAAEEGYAELRRRFPTTPVCVVGESLGSGPACHLASLPNPPGKVVLVTPFDQLAKVASRHFPFLPVSLLLHDKWDNIAALSAYKGPLEIFAATHDTVIPIAHARALASTKPQTRFLEIPGGHNDWSQLGQVQFRN